ncbi:MAG: hypothetical protein H8E90_01025 [Anaerolineales bacterium]|nr:hypothetical protein [Anaerolineales bacterium]
MTTTNKVPTLFTVWNTPIKVKPGVLVNLLVGWIALSWLAGQQLPESSWAARLLVGAISTFALLVADLGHAMAHIVSARYAGAPMDVILVSMGMPRTLYFDNDVSPQTHRLRALGGPVFNTLGLLASLLLRLLTPYGSLARYVVDWSCIGHGMILAGSLAPLPLVDGGVILKWTLVERGRTPAQADAVVRRLDLVIGAVAVTAGVVLATQRHWLLALGLTAAGAIAIGAALDKIH